MTAVSTPATGKTMQKKLGLSVFYDGACPKCVQDRQRYERLAGKAGKDVCWIDITGRDQQLRQQGVDPVKALTELHVKDENGQVHSELDAYILIMDRVPILRPFAWLIGLPVIRPVLAWMYHRQVTRRLRRSGRLPV